MNKYYMQRFINRRFIRNILIIIHFKRPKSELTWTKYQNRYFLFDQSISLQKLGFWVETDTTDVLFSCFCKSKRLSLDLSLAKWFKAISIESQSIHLCINQNLDIISIYITVSYVAYDISQKRFIWSLDFTNRKYLNKTLGHRY